MYRDNAALELGNLESEHRRSRAWSVRLLALAGALLALGVGLSAFVSDGFQPHNRRSFTGASEQWAVALGMGGFLLALGVGVLVLWWVEGTARARIFERGLAYDYLGKTTTVLWRDVERYWAAELIVNGVEHHRYSLEDRLGRRLRLSRRLLNVRDVGRRVALEVWRHQLPLTLAAHERGATLPFGALVVSPAGIGRREALLPWSEIDAVRADSRAVTVWKRGGTSAWASALRSSLPNVELLLAVVERHVRVLR